MPTITVARERVEVTHPDKVLFPATDQTPAITKGDLVEYYRRVAPVMLPHLKSRPISMQRYPGGISASGFFQKERPEFFPRYVRCVEIKTDYGNLDEVVIDHPAALVFLANQNCITPHTWLSTVDPPDSVDFPDQLVIDLDPTSGSKGDFEQVRRAAYATKELLDEVGLMAFLKTTGSRGLHVLVPLDRRENFDLVRGFAMELTAALAGRHPDELTSEHYKRKRKGRLYLDVARNAYAQTAVPPYAVRARPGAPVAMPLSWDELDDPELRSNRWTIVTAFDRIDRAGDLWKGLSKQGQSLDPARAALAKIKSGGAAPATSREEAGGRKSRRSASARGARGRARRTAGTRPSGRRRPSRARA